MDRPSGEERGLLLLLLRRQSCRHLILPVRVRCGGIDRLCMSGRRRQKLSELAHQPRARVPRSSYCGPLLSSGLSSAQRTRKKEEAERADGRSPLPSSAALCGRLPACLSAQMAGTPPYRSYQWKAGPAPRPQPRLPVWCGCSRRDRSPSPLHHPDTYLLTPFFVLSSFFTQGPRPPQAAGRAQPCRRWVCNSNWALSVAWMGSRGGVDWIEPRDGRHEALLQRMCARACGGGGNLTRHPPSIIRTTPAHRFW